MTYQQPPHTVVQLQRPPSNGLAITAMILGIVAIAIGVWSVIPFLGIVAAGLAFVPAVIGVVLGHMGVKQAQRMGGIGRGQAMTGLVLGYVTVGIIVLTTMFWVFPIFFAGAAGVGAGLSG